MNDEEKWELDFESSVIKFLDKRLKITHKPNIGYEKSFKAIRSMYLKMNRDLDIIWKTKLIGILYTGYSRVPYLINELHEYYKKNYFGPDNDPGAYKAHLRCITTLRKTQSNYRKKIIDYYAALGDRMPLDMKHEIMSFVVNLN